MKSKPSTSTKKDDDIMETDKKPGTSGEVVDDKKSRGQKRKSEDAAGEEGTSNKKVYTKSSFDLQRGAYRLMDDSTSVENHG